jgi:hypothetical protein
MHGLSVLRSLQLMRKVQTEGPENLDGIRGRGKKFLLLQGIQTDHPASCPMGTSSSLRVTRTGMTTHLQSIRGDEKVIVNKCT